MLTFKLHCSTISEQVLSSFWQLFVVPIPEIGFAISNAAPFELANPLCMCTKNETFEISEILKYIKSNINQKRTSKKINEFVFFFFHSFAFNIKFEFYNPILIKFEWFIPRFIPHHIGSIPNIFSQYFVSVFLDLKIPHHFRVLGSYSSLTVKNKTSRKKCCAFFSWLVKFLNLLIPCSLKTSINSNI